MLLIAAADGTAGRFGSSDQPYDSIARCTTSGHPDPYSTGYGERVRIASSVAPACSNRDVTSSASTGQRRWIGSHASSSSAPHRAHTHTAGFWGGLRTS